VRKGIEMDEKEILKRARAGDMAAVEWLLKRYSGLMTAIAHSVCCDPELTRPATRLAMVKAGTEVRKVKDEKELPRWFASIARRESEKFMKQHTPREVSAGMAMEELREEVSVAGSPDRVKPERLEELVLRCLMALSQPKREVLLLRYIYSPSYGEIGKIYGWDRYEVDERIAEARRELWRMLEPLGAEAPAPPRPEEEKKEEKEKEEKKEEGSSQ